MTDAVVSVDLEFLEHTPAYRAASGRQDRSGIGVSGTKFLLDLFAANDVRSTFFVVGDVAQTHPQLVERIATAGHELASHSLTHRRLTALSKDERRREVSESKDAIEAVHEDAEVRGFRAPVFDMAADHFSMLGDAGYEYDSSLLPARRIPGFYRPTQNVRTPVTATSLDPEAPPELVEVPLSVAPYARLPISGAWPRLLGRTYARVGVESVVRRNRTPVLYFHPWEFVDLPEIAGLPQRVSWRAGTWMRETLRQLVSRPWNFITLSDVVRETLSEGC